jgi:hypothetical protein
MKETHCLVDESSLRNIKLYGKTIICGLGRVDGWAVDCGESTINRQNQEKCKWVVQSTPILRIKPPTLYNEL